VEVCPVRITPSPEADPVMGGQGGPSIDQKLGLAMAARSSLPRIQGKLSLKSLTFCPSFV